jgi:hypothetical protein
MLAIEADVVAAVAESEVKGTDCERWYLGNIALRAIWDDI